MLDLETEIQNVLHAKPVTGSLTQDRLDFLIVEAENCIKSARAEIEATQPAGPSDADRSNSIESMRQIVKRAAWQAQNHIAAIDQSIDLTDAEGERQFQACVTRPQNINEDMLNRKWESFKALFDSLSGGAIYVQLERELAKTTQINGGDELSTFLLRNGEGLIVRYLAARKIPTDAYFLTVQNTAQIFEVDLIEATATILLARKLRSMWPSIKEKLFSQMVGLNDDVTRQANSWRKPQIQVQAANDGSISVSFPDMNSFRQWARSPH